MTGPESSESSFLGDEAELQLSLLVLSWASPVMAPIDDFLRRSCGALMGDGDDCPVCHVADNGNFGGGMFSYLVPWYSDSLSVAACDDFDELRFQLRLNLRLIEVVDCGVSGTSSCGSSFLAFVSLRGIGKPKIFALFWSGPVL